MSDTPARNTRSSGPTMDKFRALESGQATLGQQLKDLRAKQSSDLADARAQFQATAAEQKSRLEELQTSINAILSNVTIKTEPEGENTLPVTAVPAASATVAAPVDFAAPVVSSAAPVASSAVPVASTAPVVSSSEPSTSSGSGVTPNRHVYTIKSEDISTFDGTPENLELFWSRVQAVRSAENDANWDRAVLRAIPLALRDRAAIWHSTLTDRQRASLNKIDTWFIALRENFSPHPAIVRKQARERAWEPDVEDVLGYVFAKVALLKVAFKSMTEGDIVQEVADRMPVDIQMLLRQPHEHQPSLVLLRSELRVQEVFWRLRHNRPLIRPTDDESETTPRSSSSHRTSTFSELVRASAWSITPTPHLPARGSVAQRRGRPYAEDFDPTRLGKGKSPRTGKETIFYRVPDTSETIWCERPCRRCGANHFDFSHDHFVSQPQVRFTEEEEDDGYPTASYAVDSNNHGDSQSF
ncbi:hypothetical protein CF327_g4379 [Tilletia walkeri]|uniref:Retrotransposon gag domain-containing protein n=1 Tax=Tilletia walkeri TaxID=117179 RepID=A0A8X7T1V8_9BASI|nr:hypothetical protein CF327_g4379 [Tilletia walkeri]KAE8264479.1 hypothetical protein A4X09_0g6953 [Tilletia walkeri]